MNPDPRRRKKDQIANTPWPTVLKIAVDVIGADTNGVREESIVDLLAELDGNPGMEMPDRVHNVRSELEDTREEIAQEIKDEIVQAEADLDRATARLNAAKAKERKD